MNKPTNLILALALSFFVGVAQAQLQTPAASPTATIAQKVGLVDVKIEYSRPSAKGRKVMGELVPFGELWRTGANACSKISFSDDVTIGGTKVSKGTYSLFSIPGAQQWTIILNKNTSLAGVDGYKPEEDAVRVTVKPETISPRVETLTIGIANTKDDAGDIEISWENTRATFTFTMDTDGKVMAGIKSIMSGPSGDAYYQAAVYYLEHGKDVNQAYEWINKSIAMNGERFWVLRQKSLMEAKMNNFKGAVQTAEKSKKLASEAKNMDYVRMNEKSIAEWSKKM
ncbi:MAG: DUF2911 domain-containing protein [Spirosomataceae bacterium]